LEVLGGLTGIAKGLSVDLSRGISDEEVAEREGKYGQNSVPKTPPRSLISLFFEALSDFTMIVLTISAILSIVLDSTLSEHKETGWVSGAAILFAVFLVGSVTALNNWSKERQFRKLEATNRALISVYRNGVLTEVDSIALVVGDVVGVRTGDIIPADGVFIQGSNLSCDESAMTGESDAVKKDANRPFFLSGTKAIEGEGRMLVTSVGVNTEIGKTKAAIDAESGDQQTPLEEKLEQMAKDIGKFGLVVAVMTVIVSLIWWLVDNSRKPKAERFTKDENIKLLRFFILGVTILVVAIPEGLPLAVTISLAYSMQRMTKDKCLVRKLAACETCGGVTNICSDKTGTLTENKMTACEVFIAGDLHRDLASAKAKSPRDLLVRLCTGIAVNSSAYLTLDNSTGAMMFTGNKTETALLNMSTKFDVDWEAARKQHKREGHILSYPFSSAKKSMATVVPTPEPGAGPADRRLFVKGAPDILLNYCTHYFDASGKRAPLTEEVRALTHRSIDAMANSGLRTLLIADRDFPDAVAERDFPEAEMPLEGITMVAVVGIKDPLRPGVPEAVAKCKGAGIFVRMVTGDNVGTAKAIARECGILTDGIVVEGPTFRAMSEAERIAILPKLQVIARSSPTDKYVLVDLLIKQGEVVAVTGDGTNDAAALAKADVGLAMGIAGTQVAKDAADIIILDDNFTSIVRAVMWGRSVYDSVRKFLQFQLTINLVALLLVFIATCARYETPLTPVQMLWVNLIMDTFAALALGTEKPTEAILKRKPYGRFDELVNNTMKRNMVGGAIIQLTILLALLFAGDKIYDVPHGKEIALRHTNPATGKEWVDSFRLYGKDVACASATSRHYTIVFNVFVFLQLFNEISCHKLYDDGPSVFHGFFENPIFLSVLTGSALFQAFIVEVGRGFTNTCGLNWWMWLTCLVVGSVALPWGALVRLIPVKDEGATGSAPREPPAPRPLPLDTAPHNNHDDTKKTRATGGPANNAHTTNTTTTTTTTTATATATTTATNSNAPPPLPPLPALKPTTSISQTDF
jgi:calcium-translocating P-type ATPase